MKAFAYRVLVFSFCIVSFNNSVFSQEGVYKLNWIENGVQTFQYKKQEISFEYLRFEGASFVGENKIPEYSKTILLGNYNKEQYQVSNEKYEAVPDSLLLNCKIPLEYNPHAHKINVYKARTDSYLSLNISVLRYNPENELLERLVQFQLDKIPFASSEDYAKSNFQTKATTNSLLASGLWYRISVNETGIYKLTYGNLEGMGFTNFSHVRIFGYGSRQLGYFNNQPRPSDLAECPIYINTGTDGIFNSGDYVLFYAEGPVTWDYNASDAFFEQKLHDYSNDIFYFITASHGMGREIETVNHDDLTENMTVSSYTDYAYYEKNLLNLIQSGRIWYTEHVVSDPVDTRFQFSNIVSSSTVRVKAKIAGRSGNTRSTSLMINDEIVDTKTFPSVNLYVGWMRYAYDVLFDYSFSSAHSEIKVGLKYQNTELSDKAYLDYITSNARCQLSVNKTPFFFRDNLSVGENNIARFVVDQVSGNNQVWDVTDINNVIAIDAQATGTTLEFKAETDSLKEYVIVDPSYDYPRPYTKDSRNGVGPVENQNIHGLNAYNYIIVAKEEFHEQAERLADYHRNNSGLSVLVISPEKIYNEFSSGTPDVTALKDFFRHQYQLSSGDDGLKYVLLFGDGSYNNHMNVEGNTNYILTYQSENSLEPVNSYITDDFFGLLDENEGEAQGKLDIGIGRLPVKLIKGDDIEAEQVVDKILSYYESKMTDWRRLLCFMGDDGYDGSSSNDGITHMRDADSLATLVEGKFPGFETKKILLDAYPQVALATGPSYPDAKKELMDVFHKGILVFNYCGHGGENGITGEKVLLTSDVASMRNIDYLPLFITATCEFSRFDDVIMENNEISPKTTAGETVILNPEGGGVASLTTTRVVYSSQNYNLAYEVLKILFSSDDEGNPYRLGDVVRIAKNNLTNDTNKLNFTLLGDPAMILKYPRFKIITDSINHISVNSQPDTLKAFGEITVSGYVSFDDSTIINDFNGIVYPHVYDKAIQITTLGNDGISPYTYKEQKNLLYKGKATVNQGRFSFSFVVPKDISYNIGKGKISYYAENGTIDAKGEIKDVFIGGTDSTAELDYDGPEISLYMNNESFEDGGITNEEPFLYAKLHDDNGINTTGVGIGHDITAVLDWDELKPFVLNEYYQTDIDDFRSGTVVYQLSELEEGDHYLSMKAWDVFNNSSDADLNFVVVIHDGLFVNAVLNYPNPVIDDYTYFQYTHNFPGEDHQVTLEIYDLSGRLVTSISRTLYESGFVSTPLLWERRSGTDLSTGVYPYRLIITTSGGTSYINQKLIILR